NGRPYYCQRSKHTGTPSTAATHERRATAGGAGPARRPHRRPHRSILGGQRGQRAAAAGGGGEAARAAPLPPAAAPRLRRRGGRPRHLVPHHGGGGEIGREHGVVHRPDQRLRYVGRVPRAGGGAPDLGRAERGAELGSAPAVASRRGGRRPSPERGVEL